jgi:hypothetical protein
MGALPGVVVVLAAFHLLRLGIPVALLPKNTPMQFGVNIQVGLLQQNHGLLNVQTTAEDHIFLMMNLAGVVNHGHIPLN